MSEEAKKNAPPSIDPSELGDLPGMIRAVLKKFLQSVDDMLPAVVVAYDRASNRATVQPMIQMVTTEGESLGRASVASVPVLMIGGGGYFMSYNLKPGDLGWIKANDRDISLYMQGCAQNKPNTQRLHSFQDSLFVPDTLKDFTIDDEDQENATWQSLDGTVRIALWPNKIKFTAPAIEFETTGAGGMTHNGQNIGNTHVHPQGPDSAGNTQQNTGYPQ